MPHHESSRRAFLRPAAGGGRVVVPEGAFLTGAIHLRTGVNLHLADGAILLVANVPPGSPAVYYAGFAWDKGSDIVAVGDWDTYLERFARRMRSPLEVHFGNQRF